MLRLFFMKIVDFFLVTCNEYTQNLISQEYFPPRLGDGTVDLCGWAISCMIVITLTFIHVFQGLILTRLPSSLCLERGYNSLSRLLCIGQPIWILYIHGISVLSLFCFELNIYDISEFQGSSPDALGLTAPVLSCIWQDVEELTLLIPGYGCCRTLTGPDF